MGKQKKRLSKNAEIIITCIITLALCLASYVLALLVKTPEGEIEDKKIMIWNGFNDYKKVLPVLSDGLAPSLIVWCIIGLISNFSQTNYLKTSKIPVAIAIPTFILYIIWYIVYLAIKEMFFGIVIANLALFGVVLIVALLFFNEYEKGTKEKK